MRTFLLITFISAVISGCGGSGTGETTAPSADSLNVITGNDTSRLDFDNNLERFSKLSGLIGVYPLKPMLALCRKDSASLNQLAEAVGDCFGVVARQAVRSGVTARYAGQISYNNNPDNFIFETVFLIDKAPERTPDSAKVILLEPGNFLVYNFYGNYAGLHRGYENIRSYCEQAGLSVAGPMREFYMNDPVSEPDSARWLTRIMVQVVPKKKQASI